MRSHRARRACTHHDRSSECCGLGCCTGHLHQGVSCGPVPLHHNPSDNMTVLPPTPSPQVFSASGGRALPPAPKRPSLPQTGELSSLVSGSSLIPTAPTPQPFLVAALLGKAVPDTPTAPSLPETPLLPGLAAVSSVPTPPTIPAVVPRVTGGSALPPVPRAPTISSSVDVPSLDASQGVV